MEESQLGFTVTAQDQVAVIPKREKINQLKIDSNKCFQDHQVPK